MQFLQDYSCLTCWSIPPSFTEVFWNTDFLLCISKCYEISARLFLSHMLIYSSSFNHWTNLKYRSLFWYSQCYAFSTGLFLSHLLIYSSSFNHWTNLKYRFSSWYLTMLCNFCRIILVPVNNVFFFKSLNWIWNKEFCFGTSQCLCRACWKTLINC